FAVNISTVFTELKLLDRFAAAAEAGFPAVEMQFPYECPADDLARAREAAGLDAVVLLNFPASERGGIASLPGRTDEVAAGLETARRYAETLGVKQINLLRGAPGPGVDKVRARAALIENFRRAARAMKEVGVTVLLEPINNLDVAGYFIPTIGEAITVLDEV